METDRKVVGGEKECGRNRETDQQIGRQNGRGTVKEHKDFKN